VHVTIVVGTVGGVLAIVVITHIAFTVHLLHHLFFKDEDSGRFN
jgi:hypothetical protein